ncbi:MAG: hypothetical protein ACR2RE_06865, partial [Geminicoccaceae bacterium]
MPQNSEAKANNSVLPSKFFQVLGARSGLGRFKMTMTEALANVAYGLFSNYLFSIISRKKSPKYPLEAYFPFSNNVLDLVDNTV